MIIIDCDLPTFIAENIPLGDDKHIEQDILIPPVIIEYSEEIIIHDCP